MQALEGNQPVVTYEVVVGVASCVARAPQELSEPAWDSVLRILRAVVSQDSKWGSSGANGRRHVLTIRSKFTGPLEDSFTRKVNVTKGIPARERPVIGSIRSGAASPGDRLRA